VFYHRDHISTIRATFHAIFNTWLPESGHRIAEGPEFEKYGKDFDPQRGTGTVEIWIPVE
jgi:AraC family transcriptional regulator